MQFLDVQNFFGHPKIFGRPEIDALLDGLSETTALGQKQRENKNDNNSDDNDNGDNDDNDDDDHGDTTTLEKKLQKRVKTLWQRLQNEPKMTRKQSNGWTQNGVKRGTIETETGNGKTAKQ